MYGCMDACPIICPHVNIYNPIDIPTTINHCSLFIELRPREQESEHPSRSTIFSSGCTISPWLRGPEGKQRQGAGFGSHRKAEKKLKFKDMWHIWKPSTAPPRYSNLTYLHIYNTRTNPSPRRRYNLFPSTASRNAHERPNQPVTWVLSALAARFSSNFLVALLEVMSKQCCLGELPGWKRVSPKARGSDWRGPPKSTQKTTTKCYMNQMLSNASTMAIIHATMQLKGCVRFHGRVPTFLTETPTHCLQVGRRAPPLSARPAQCPRAADRCPSTLGGLAWSHPEIAIGFRFIMMLGKIVIIHSGKWR